MLEEFRRVEDQRPKAVTLDLSKVDRTNRELAMAYSALTGAQTISLPDTIDKAFYDKLIDLDTNQNLKEDFFAKLAPRLSGRALEAARQRLDDAIAHARFLNDNDKVFKDEDWQNPAKLKSLGKIHSSVNVYDANGARINVDPRQFPEIKQAIERYLIGSCGNFYNRDYLSGLFEDDGQ